MGAVKYFLGKEIVRSKKGISLYQRKYALELLLDARLVAAELVNFSKDSHSKLYRTDGSSC